MIKQHLIPIILSKASLKIQLSTKVCMLLSKKKAEHSTKCNAKFLYFTLTFMARETESLTLISMLDVKLFKIVFIDQILISYDNL